LGHWIFNWDGAKVIRKKFTVLYLNMLNNRVLILCALLLAFLSETTGFSMPVFAQQVPFVTERTPSAADQDSPEMDEQQAAPPAFEQPAPTATKSADISSERDTSGGPLTVTDVIIDKTDKNAVVARDQAIIEAQRTAFEVLAEKSMSPEAFKAYKVPDNKTIAALVEDFEIKNEQMTANRYVASFTVRFTPEINNYIKIPEGLGKVIAAAPPAVPAVAAPAVASAATPSLVVTSQPAAPATPVVPAGPRNVLILPYFENASGRKVLWDDPNPWRDAWQEAGSSTPAPGLTISVPLGDLTDVASGNTDSVWKNDFSTIEKSRTNYNATEVALLVAHAGKGIDIYIYRDGKLEREKAVSGKYSDPDSYKKAIARVITALKAPEPFAAPPAPAVQTVSAPTETAPPAALEAAPAADAEKQDQGPAGKVAIEATMNFGNFSQWMEAQKRLAAISPPVEIDISSLTKDQAQFTLDYDGGLAAFKNALAGKGLALGQPVVDVDVSVPGSDKPTQRTVYELRLLN
jgi:hypothetical protein